MSRVDVLKMLRSGLRCKCGTELRNVAADEIERLRREVDKGDKIGGMLLVENNQMREALDLIASDPDQSYAGRFRYHKGRADGLRCAGAVARAALESKL